MRKIIWVTAAALLVLVAGSSGRLDATAQTPPLIPCYGAPADYVAANDAVDGVTDGAVSYPEARMFVEVQSHLQPPGETERHHFEHIHIGMCFPYAEKWVQAPTQRKVNVRYVFHHVENYNIVNVSSNFVDANNSGGGYVATAAQKAELETAMDASAGTTTTVMQSYTMSNIGTSCRKTFRPQVNTVRANAAALVDEWFTAGQWTTYIDYAGQPVCTPELNRDQMRSRSWVLPAGGYLYTPVIGTPKASEAAVPHTDSYDFIFGSTGQPLFVHVDPQFHQHPEDPGVYHAALGSFPDGDNPISVPLETVGPGEHRLMLTTTRGIQSSIVVVPFSKPGDGCD